MNDFTDERYSDEEPAHPDTMPPPEADYEERGDMGPLWGAFAKAQAGFKTLVKSKHVKVVTREKGTYEFDYAPLEEVLASCVPALNAEGLALLQPYSGLNPGKVLRTMLVHSSGASLTLKVRIPPAAKIQDLGSSLTYIRRYSVQCLLGVNAEDDDDGNQADGNQATAAPKTRVNPPARKADPPPTDTDPQLALRPETRAKIIALAKAAGFTGEDLRAFYLRSFNAPLASVDSLLEPSAQALVEALESLKVSK